MQPFSLLRSVLVSRIRQVAEALGPVWEVRKYRPERHYMRLDRSGARSIPLIPPDISDRASGRSRSLFHSGKTLAAGGQHEPLMAPHARLDAKSHLLKLRANT